MNNKQSRGFAKAHNFSGADSDEDFEMGGQHDGPPGCVHQ